MCSIQRRIENVSVVLFSCKNSRNRTDGTIIITFILSISNSCRIWWAEETKPVPPQYAFTGRFVRFTVFTYALQVFIRTATTVTQFLSGSVDVIIVRRRTRYFNRQSRSKATTLAHTALQNQSRTLLINFSMSYVVCTRAIGLQKCNLQKRSSEIHRYNHVKSNVRKTRTIGRGGGQME